MTKAEVLIYVNVTEKSLLAITKEHSRSIPGTCKVEMA